MSSGGPFLFVLRALRAMLPGLLLRETLVRSWLARQAHQHQARVVVAAGLTASVLALTLHAFDRLAADRTDARHDALLKMRLSSPAPSPRIVIVDVDERALAQLAPTHGRWPWPREVWADGLARLEAAGVASVMLNVLWSDPDLRNPDGDAALEAAATLMRPLAFPLVRLDPAGDAQSRLRVAGLPGARLDPSAAPTRTVAAVLPFSPSMHDRLGVANVATGGDGIVREYAWRWQDDGWSMPSLAAAALAVSGLQPAAAPPDRLLLNWRNKRGDYRRLSFAELLTLPDTHPDWQALRGAIAVVGVSAPGAAPVRATAVAPLVDDATILATALDDALNDSRLRLMPAAAVLALTLAGIWTVVLLFLRRVQAERVNAVFVTLQTLLGGITLLSVSYTNHLVDLTQPMAYVFAVFTAIKAVQLLGERWSRGAPGYRRAEDGDTGDRLAIVGYLRPQVEAATVQRWQRHLEQQLGLGRVLRIDGIFSGGHLLQRALGEYECLVLLLESEQVAGVERMFRLDAERDVEITLSPLDHPWQPHSDSFARWAAPRFLDNCARLVTRPAAAAPGMPEVPPPHAAD